MSIPTRRLDALDQTLNPERDHEVAAMRDGISNRLRVEQILSLLQSSDIPDGAVTLAKLALNARADIASAETTDIGAETTQYLRVTGTTTITGLGTAAAGVVRDLLFADALTLTHNATSLILPGGDDITTAAGDVALFRSEGSGNWRCVRYSKADGTAVAVAAPEIIQSDVRQTVNAGPVNGDGRADFLAAGTGLEVVTTGLTTTPLNLTMGNGFGPRGKVDLSFEVDANLSWGSLPDATDPIYLYLEWDGSTLSTGHSTLAPEYSLAKPSSPATGQYWYPTDHRGPGEVRDGAEWSPVYRIYVGECATSGGSVVSVTSYAYQGRFASNRVQGPSGSGRIIWSHNIGVGDKNQSVCGIKAYWRDPAAHNYEIGDVLEVGFTKSNSTSTDGLSVHHDKLNVQIVLNRLATRPKDASSGSSDIDADRFDLQAFVERNF